ncbi:MAG: hypothetical protein J5379_00155 [Clostridiales bacterium]|nr:hypothetical protein [Clostridiales bacterium]
MKRIIAFLTVLLMALGMCSCKSEFSSKISDTKDALEEVCGAKKAEDEQYSEMVDTKYSVVQVAADFKEGVYSEVKSKDFTFFGFHTVVDQSHVKSVFKYLKADPDSEESGSVANMEVLVIQFKNDDAAQKYYDTILALRKQTYQNNENLGGKMKNEFVSKKDYFAFACETDFMVFNAYASIDGSTVFYAFVEGPNAETLKNEYYAFMKKMECSIITL